MLQKFPIEGTNGMYVIDRHGIIYQPNKRESPKNRKRIATRIRQGYIVVRLTVNKRIKQFAIHRLLAKQFVPNPENKPEVNHKNGVKTDNRISNLEWCTKSENQKHQYYYLRQKNKTISTGKQLPMGVSVNNIPKTLLIDKNPNVRN